MPSLPLVIDHQDQAFILRRHDGKSADPVTLPSPYQWPVSNRPNSNLMAELRWYLEKFLEYPFPPETTHAEAVLDALKAWGTACFNHLFDRRDAPAWLNQSGILQIRSDDPHTLSWPWEALYDPQSNYLAHERQIERCVNKIKDPPALTGLPQDRVNILLVVARPYEGDVRFRSIARPLIDLIKNKGLPAHAHLLRPPTFDLVSQPVQI